MRFSCHNEAGKKVDNIKYINKSGLSPLKKKDNNKQHERWMNAMTS